MPELPEVETIRRGLESRLLGRRIVSATLHRADVCTVAPGVRRGRAALLQDGVVHRLDRRGKQLAMVAADGRVLVVHLGMSGQLRVVGAGDAAPRDHVHARWRFDDGCMLVFRDPRRFGGLWALGSTAQLEARWAGLGPDAAGIGGNELAARMGSLRRAIKAALLDQRVLAGVGNIYADEALYRARIRPDRLCATIGPGECERLARVIRETLAAAIRAGGSTLRDYTAANGEAGQAQQRHQVYARGGEACRRCGGVLAVSRLAQRATVWCPGCQA